MLIDVAFQVLIVTGVPFKFTKLPPCVTPNQKPEIIT
jgi:hypothetical protein